ncbi:RNA polymerase sigma-70 factor [Sunxiuqinia sp. sy24]|uniref:RNA polymerase sigma-70 factor n=1 Tax=Sunxiuqinia sp. sy24 TaxID=3461495 RepID=UPI0040467956
MTIHKLQKNDIKALEDLYDNLYERLYLFLIRISKSHEVSEDIIQSTFIKVWDNRKKLSTEKPLDAQVFVIARNLLLNYIKRQGIEQQVISSLTAVGAEVKDGMQEVYCHEIQDIYENTINQLPKKRKEIYKLRYLKGFSNKEIAEKLDISPNTVENHLSQANGFIRKRMDFLKQSSGFSFLLFCFIKNLNRFL